MGCAPYFWLLCPSFLFPTHLHSFYKCYSQKIRCVLFHVVVLSAVLFVLIALLRCPQRAAWRGGRVQGAARRDGIRRDAAGRNGEWLDSTSKQRVERDTGCGGKSGGVGQDGTMNRQGRVGSKGRGRARSGQASERGGGGSQGWVQKTKRMSTTGKEGRDDARVSSRKSYVLKQSALLCRRNPHL